VNAYAAQEILKNMPLKTFVECGHDERLNAFLEMVGLKVLVTEINWSIMRIVEFKLIIVRRQLQEFLMRRYPTIQKISINRKYRDLRSFLLSIDFFL
jgi:hypothetical protein